MRGPGSGYVGILLNGEPALPSFSIEQAKAATAPTSMVLRAIAELRF